MSQNRKQPPPIETLLTRLNRARTGDERAMTEIMVVYEHWINAIFKTKKIQVQEWETLRNEVWVCCFHWLPAFRRERTGAFRAALRTIATRVAADHVDQRAKDRSLTLDPESWIKVEADQASFEDLADVVDTKDLIDVLLRTLGDEFSPEATTILRLTFWDGLNATDIGIELKMSSDAVRQARSRAYAELRRILIEYYGYDAIGSDIQMLRPRRNGTAH